MAAQWVPKKTDPVDSREPIGRRLFAIPELAGAKDQKPWKDLLKIDHFKENRPPGNISLDRLGEKSVDGKVRKYLIRRAQDAGTKLTPPKDFDGWVCVRADKLAKPGKGLINFPVVASPIESVDPQAIECNPYHAHVCGPAGQTPYVIAMHLKQIFVNDGKIECVTRKDWWWKYWQYVIREFNKLLKVLGLSHVYLFIRRFLVC